MTYEAINFGKKFSLFREQWQPRVIAEMNDYQFKLVKFQGDFIWHKTDRNSMVRTKSRFSRNALRCGESVCFSAVALVRLGADTRRRSSSGSSAVR